MTIEADIKELGSWVARTRIQNQITQAELANRCGVAKRTLERFEQGESIGLSTFLKILKELNLFQELKSLIPEKVEGPMSVLRGERKIKKRVRSKMEDPTKGKWVWGEDK